MNTAQTSVPQPVVARRVPLTAMRRAIIERVVRSKRDIPHFYLTQEIEMHAAQTLMEELLAMHPQPRLTLTHLLLKVVASLLLQHPRLNARLIEEEIEEYASVHLGFVVGLEDGMIIPVLHHAERMSLLELAHRAIELEAGARARRLQAGDLTGRTFTLSNMGMLDIDAFQAVISPPDAAILAVGRVAKRPVVRDDQLIVAPTMIATLACDHRLVDGAHGARFMADLRQTLEDAQRLKSALRV
ncbi:MAG: 2-oxo acid dehydrogenase subunit E2 [Anaerolineae bacterium]|nr:2-oxo acid dehydrogenase subunit E2 [Anaerolineae bacterium]